MSSPRAIRRAAEREAQKLARKAAQPNQNFSANHPQPEPRPAISEAQLAANRANAALSTGPTSSEGKVKSALNAVKTGLTGRTVLLPTDDAAAYEHHVREFQLEYRPVGTHESLLVQSIADSFWRIQRIRSLEMAIFARGRCEFAEQFEHEDRSCRAALIDCHTFLSYEKQIRNLQIQEARLFRRYEKDSAELRTIKQQRRAQEAEADETVCKSGSPARPRTATNGFEFSNSAPVTPVPAPTPNAEPEFTASGPEFIVSAA